MGFPSPATDYVERSIDLNDVCHITMNSKIYELQKWFSCS